jgi:hypothetical protein
MSADVLLEYAMIADGVIVFGIFSIMAGKRLLRKYASLSSFLAVLFAEKCISVATLFFRSDMGLSRKLDYEIYSATNWICSCVLSVLFLLIIYSVFRHAMKPLEGLHRVGKIIFRWIFGASLVVSLVVAIGPHAGTSTASIQKISGQIQQATSILTICLLLFVCFAIRHLGLTYRSHIFGISLGLGVFATVSLVEAAWFSSTDAQNLYSPMYLYSALGVCVALSIWGTYFALPEPERKMIMLPTTSPYFLWNRISEALGDDPGDVVIAGFTPSMMAPQELEFLAASSRHGQLLEQSRPAAPAAEAIAERPAFAMQQ